VPRRPQHLQRDKQIALARMVAGHQSTTPSQDHERRWARPPVARSVSFLLSISSMQSHQRATATLACSTSSRGAHRPDGLSRFHVPCPADQQRVAAPNRRRLPRNNIVRRVARLRWRSGSALHHGMTDALRDLPERGLSSVTPISEWAAGGLFPISGRLARSRSPTCPPRSPPTPHHMRAQSPEVLVAMASGCGQ